jgi:hypothetical protein
MEKDYKYIIINGEEFVEGDRVRLKESINGLKKSALCEIIKIKNEQNISLLCVYDHAKVTVNISEIEDN